jgi:hypothetical protein
MLYIITDILSRFCYYGWRIVTTGVAATLEKAVSQSGCFDLQII